MNEILNGNLFPISLDRRVFSVFDYCWRSILGVPLALENQKEINQYPAYVRRWHIFFFWPKRIAKRKSETDIEI